MGSTPVLRAAWSIFRNSPIPWQPINADKIQSICSFSVSLLTFITSSWEKFAISINSWSVLLKGDSAPIIFEPFLPSLYSSEFPLHLVKFVNTFCCPGVLARFLSDGNTFQQPCHIFADVIHRHKPFFIFSYFLRLRTVNMVPIGRRNHGIEQIVKYLLITSKEAVVPARLADKTRAAGLNWNAAPPE